MKKIISSLVLITIVAVGAIGATRAYFTDQKVLGTTTLTSGTLSVNPTSNGKNYLDLGNFSKLAPGDVTPEMTITVKNDGSINAATFGKFILGDTSGLENVLNFYDYKVTFYNANGSLNTTRGVDTFVQNGVGVGAFATQYANGIVNLKAWLTGSGPLDVDTPWDEEGMKPGEYYVISFKLQMDKLADNSYQNKYLNLGYEVDSTQIYTDAILGLNLGGLLSQKDYVQTHVVSYMTTQVTNH